MERYAFKDIEDWVNKPRRKPLLLRGAGQVGKTWQVEELGKQVFDNFLKIDFEERSLQTTTNKELRYVFCVKFYY